MAGSPPGKFAEDLDRGAEKGAGARRFDVVLPHAHTGVANTQQSVAPQPFAGDHSRLAPPAPAAEASVRPLYAEGYTGEMSYVAGDTIEFHVSTSAPHFNLEIARIGGKVESVLSVEAIPGQAHDVPENAASHGCGWPVTYTLAVPPNWTSGYYEATLHVEDDGGDWTHRGRRTASSVMGFAVRAPPLAAASSSGAPPPILLILSTNTYVAYNNWGGHCFYGGFGRNEAQGTRLSFHRPMAGLYHKWEHHFVHWAEKNGYTLAFAANQDLERVPNLLTGYRCVVSVGHDEYWSAGMRDTLEAWIGEGGNVAFFSGNSICWRVRPEDEHHTLVCYKQNYVVDPAWNRGEYSELATLWSHHLLGRPENTLTGVGFLHGGYHRAHGVYVEPYVDPVHGTVMQPGGYSVHRPGHWVFAGLDDTSSSGGAGRGAALSVGDSFGAAHTVVGYECDGCEFRLDPDSGLPVPTHSDGTPRTFEIVASAPAKWSIADAFWYDEFERGREGAACMGCYRSEATERGGEVFTSGSTDWVHGLVGPELGVPPPAFVTYSTVLRRDLDGETDPVVECVTRNVLARFAQQAPPPPPPRSHSPPAKL